MFWIATIGMFAVIGSVCWVVWLVVDWAIETHAKVKAMWERLYAV